MKKAFIVLLLLAVPADPAMLPWLRRLSLAGSCAVSFFGDYASTREAAKLHAREANPFLRGHDGGPNLPLVFGLKAGGCAASAFIQELSHSPKVDGIFIGANVATAGVFTWATIHNRQVIDDLRAKGK